MAEAAALMAHDPPLPDGAFYLAGYAVECALKAAIARRFAEHVWPDKTFVNNCYTHDLGKLLMYADLKAAFDLDTEANESLDENFAVVWQWHEGSRYETHSHAKTQRMLEAIIDPTNGVLPWIKARW